MIHLILTGNAVEASNYVSAVFPRDIDKTHIVNHKNNIEGVRGPFILHFMTSWDDLSFEERVPIIDWINRETSIQLGLAEQRGRRDREDQLKEIS